MTDIKDSDNVLLSDRSENVAILTLNVPQRKNAYSTRLRDALLANVSQLMQDDSCGAIVITGAGGNFCAGGDIGQMERRTLLRERHAAHFSHRLVRILVNGPKPVLAAVEGYAYGVGLSIVAACDYVVADPGAKFCSAFIRVGLMPGAGLCWTLPRKVGPAKAEELMLLGTAFGADEAARMGLVNQIAEPGKTLIIAIEMARKYAAQAPIAIAMTKAALGSGSSTLERTFLSETDLQPVLTQTDDHGEAVAALREKRKPVFKGA